MINKQIEMLAEESGMTQYVAKNNKFLERFAELIIEACVEECEKKNPHPDQWSDMSEYTEKRVALACAQAIKDRFNLS